MKCFLIIIISFFTFTAYSQKNNSSIREIKNDTDLLHTTTWLSLSNESIPGIVTGTGFLYAQKNDIYIITNRHLVENRTHLNFDISWSNDRNFIGIDSLQNRVKKFTTSTKRDEDLVAIKISGIPYVNIDTFSKWKAFSKKNIPTKNDIKTLSIFHEKIVSLAYPGEITVPYPPYPFIFNCSFGSNYEWDYLGQKVFFINTDLTHGCSGAPIVSVTTPKKYILLGVEMATFEQPQTIDSVTFIDTDKRWAFWIKEPYKLDNKVENMSNYRVWTSRHISTAIKSEKIIDLFSQ